MKTAVTLLVLFTLFSLNTFAQDSPQWHLPEGAKARLGKGTIQEIQYSPDGTRLAVAGSIGIWLYDTSTYQEVALLTGHTGWVLSVAFSPDGNTLASGSSDGTVRLWDARTGAHLQTLTGHTNRVESVAFSPDGNTLASGSYDGTVRLWDARTGAHLQTLGHTDSVFSVAFSPDGNTIASGSRDETVRLWDARTGADLQTLIGHTDSVFSVAFSPDGSTLASGSLDDTVLLWDMAPSLSITMDVNRDGVVNVIDLALVALRFGQTGQTDADVNGDGVVDIDDLIQVAGIIGSTGQAPQARPLALTTITPADVQSWIDQAEALNRSDAMTQRGIRFLEQLLAALRPAETVLLPNYPNPFNPETWIPYHLAHNTDVSLTIYDSKGEVVRRLDLGHQLAGYYTDRTKAAYWDGRNEQGELVASGVYFYHLSVGDYSQVRRMVIVK